MRTLFFAFTLLSVSCLSAVNCHEVYQSDSRLVEAFGDSCYSSYTKSLVLVDLIQNAKDPSKKVSFKSQLEAEVYLMLDRVDWMITIMEKNIDEYSSRGEVGFINMESKRLEDFRSARSQAEKLLEYAR